MNMRVTIPTKLIVTFPQKTIPMFKFKILKSCNLINELKNKLLLLIKVNPSN